MKTGAKPSMLHEAFHYGDVEHAHYEKYGYFIFDHFLTDEATAVCRGHLDRMFTETHPECPPEEIISAHQQGERWIWDLAVEPRLLDMIERHIGPNILFWSTQALSKPPRTGMEVPWHQDAPYWNISGKLPGSVWIPLDDTDTENGTLSILPRWHTRGHLPRKQTTAEFFTQEIDPEALPENIDQLKVTYNLKAGQMATHDTLLPHSSTPNRSDRWRRHIGFRYMAADGQLGDKSYRNFRTLEPFPREFFLVRGEDVKGYGLKRSPF